MASHSHPTALDAVFSITELFELILSQLPMRDLLLAQLVCTRWATFISTSPTLQAALFFTASASPHTRFNPLLVEMFPPFFSPKIEEACGHWTDECVDFSGKWEMVEGVMFQQPCFLDEGKRKRVLRREASWRKMFPMQPAPRIERVSMTGGCYCGGPTVEECVVADAYEERQDGTGEEGSRGGEGARMGLVWDVLVWIFDEWPEVSFFLEWPNVKYLRGVGQREEDLDRMVVDSEDSELEVVDESEGGSPPDVETSICGEEGDGERKGLVMLITHSKSCYSARRGGVYESVSPWPRSGLAICEFGEDLVRVVTTFE